MNIRFYMTPGSCSTGIHILLEELELVFEVYLVDLMKGDSRTPEYLAMNSKGTIPTLHPRGLRFYKGVRGDRSFLHPRRGQGEKFRRMLFQPRSLMDCCN